jgi:hypothetical protein
MDLPDFDLPARGFPLHRLGGFGVYLLLIAGAGYYMRYFGGEWGEALQLVLLFGGVLFLGC